MSAAKDLVLAFLTTLEARDLAKAGAFLAPGAAMTFPGNVKFSTLADLVAWLQGRYRKVGKTYKHFDERVDGDVTTVYCFGALAGEWPDGTAFADIRFLDRFEIRGGKIVDQQVWNDLAEARALW